MPIDEGIRGEESETRGALNLSLFPSFLYVLTISEHLARNCD